VPAPFVAVTLQV